MRLNDGELAEVTQFLRGKGGLPGPKLLEKMELGIWLFPPFSLAGMNISDPEFTLRATKGQALFVAGRFGNAQSAQLLYLFREQRLPYLLVRVGSWEAYLNCKGEILSEYCDEDLDAIREACERLRQRCREQHPSVSAP